MSKCEKCFTELYPHEVNMLGKMCLCAVCYLILLSRNHMKEDKDE